MANIRVDLLGKAATETATGKFWVQQTWYAGNVKRSLDAKVASKISNVFPKNIDALRSIENCAIHTEMAV